MNRLLSSVAIRFEHDVVLARQRARQIAGLLGFESRDQVRIATAVSEIARNAFRYAQHGRVEFGVSHSSPAAFQIRVTDQGPGIPHLKEVLDGKYVSATGMGMGIVGARRLMDEFEVESTPRGTTVLLIKLLPKRSSVVTDESAAQLVDQLFRQPPQDPYEEMQRQNQDLLSTLAEVQRQKSQLAQLNQELEDTNRGVVALYAELDERADYLRRASETKTQFLSNMTHEFRTPLNSILSLSRILLDRLDGDLTEEQEKQVRFVQKAAYDLNELVNDLLDLAKVEAGKVTIRPHEFYVRDLLAALRGMLRPLLASNSAVSLVFEDNDSLPLLNTDESKVSQILRNVISNALKYTEHGEVRVSASGPEQGMISIQVADSGIGIAHEDQERIFEEFTQVEGPHQRGKSGTGLGLPLSRKLAGLLGGTLTVSSEPGKGSVFTLKIPAQYKGEPDVVTFVPETTNELDPNREPILVVEDNQETLFIYEKFLKGTGFQAIPAKNIRQAREGLERFRPSAIILDVLLAHESTWALLSELKQNSETRKIPVLVVTMVDNENKATALGADAFHTKPIDRQWLINQLARLKTGDSKQVLIIDDDAASRYVLAGLLASTRFRHLEAHNAQTGLELARERKPAAIFLDLKMPDLSGFKVLDLLKADPETSRIPVIVHTSKSLTAADRERLAGRVVAVIKKNHDNRKESARLIQEALVKAAPPFGAHAENHA